MQVNGKTIHVQAKDQDIFAKLCNLCYFEKFLPEQVKDWEAGEDYCQFSIPGITTIKLSIAEKKEFSKILYAASNDKNIPMSISIYMDSKDDGTDIHADIDADVPIFLSAMVKKPLQNLVDMIADRVKTEVEN